ncbi:tyrosine-protein phosphatase [Staphylococcus kloosii]|jgi:protein-tyrosine phosphatase|uniref:Tyrosine-protein phosphatase n=1 Tax=Staphylococcus kloosii TaxID=29384 RepID=A0A921KWD4_9STAP|nr:CpsB/CapC family capsule biosynthesis tyrosine phosphatase [Staphylococcus kloosii]MBF7021755.1 capsular biosynthesis protein [Staphylococcus kloosii]MCD8878974.1 capsular biosynthesis protein [Staphylococcus kloosii]HJF68495.1 capsular biosynthesis protein [Staphylococcus kloosii]
MIDIHNHILPGIDDGPKDIAQSIDLLQQAKSQGITGIIATPHHLSPRYTNNIQNVKSLINEMMQIPAIRNIGITIYHGQEIRLTDQIVDEITKGNISGLNDSQYLLIEFPSNEVPLYTKQLFYELQLMGFIPIIAHPERNKILANDLNMLFDLINIGALSQLTASSLLGNLGKKIQKTSLKMINYELAHFVASDAHHSVSRPFEIKQLFKHRKLKKLNTKIETMFNHSQLIIENSTIDKQQPINVTTKR